MAAVEECSVDAQSEEVDAAIVNGDGLSASEDRLEDTETAPLDNASADDVKFDENCNEPPSSLKPPDSCSEEVNSSFSQDESVENYPQNEAPLPEEPFSESGNDVGKTSDGLQERVGASPASVGTVSAAYDPRLVGSFAPPGAQSPPLTAAASSATVATSYSPYPGAPQIPVSSAGGVPYPFFPNPFMAPFMPQLPDAALPQAPHQSPPGAADPKGGGCEPEPDAAAHQTPPFPMIPSGPSGPYGQVPAYPPFMYQEMLKHYFQLMMHQSAVSSATTAPTVNSPPSMPFSSPSPSYGGSHGYANETAETYGDLPPSVDGGVGPAAGVQQHFPQWAAPQMSMGATVPPFCFPSGNPFPAFGSFPTFPTMPSQYPTLAGDGTGFPGAGSHRFSARGSGSTSPTDSAKSSEHDGRKRATEDSATKGQYLYSYPQSGSYVTPERYAAETEPPTTNNSSQHQPELTVAEPGTENSTIESLRSLQYRLYYLQQESQIGRRLADVPEPENAASAPPSTAVDGVGSLGESNSNSVGAIASDRSSTTGGSLNASPYLAAKDGQLTNGPDQRHFTASQGSSVGGRFVNSSSDHADLYDHHPHHQHFQHHQQLQQHDQGELRSDSPDVPEANPTMDLIKKQISEIEREINRRMGNQNIKKINPREIEAYLAQFQESLVHSLAAPTESESDAADGNAGGEGRESSGPSEDFSDEPENVEWEQQGGPESNGGGGTTNAANRLRRAFQPSTDKDRRTLNELRAPPVDQLAPQIGPRGLLQPATFGGGLANAPRLPPQGLPPHPPFLGAPGMNRFPGQVMHSNGTNLDDFDPRANLVNENGTGSEGALQQQQTSVQRTLSSNGPLSDLGNGANQQGGQDKILKIDASLYTATGGGDVKNREATRPRSASDSSEPVWVLRESYVRKLKREEERHAAVEAEQEKTKRGPSHEPGNDSDTDTETDRLLGQQRISGPVPTEDDLDLDRKRKGGKAKRKEVMIHEPAVLIEGVLFRAHYLGSTQLICEGRPTKATRMIQAQEAVSRIKAPEGETQPTTEVDLFISTEKIMVLNTDLQDIMMDHPLRTISYIADIGDLVVLMARRVSQPSGTPGSDPHHPDHDHDPSPSGSSSGQVSPSSGIMRRTPKIVCHVFESDEAQFIAQSIGQAFQVAYIEFLRQNGIEDTSYLRELDYQEVLNSQEIVGDELEFFAKRELQKDVVVPKAKGETLGLVIVESGWGSMLPTVVIANLSPVGAAARSNQLNIGDQIIALNGISLVGLPLQSCQTHIKNTKHLTAVKLTVVHTPPVVEVRIKRPDTKYQLGFSVQNGVVSPGPHFYASLIQICSLLRGGIAERGGVRVGHRIIEINGLSVVAVAHEKIVTMLATAVGEIQMKTMPTSMFRLLTGQEVPQYL